MLHFYDSVNGQKRQEVAGNGGYRREKRAQRREGKRVTSRGSHQRLFCGFDSHWLATDRHFSRPALLRRNLLSSSSSSSSLCYLSSTSLLEFHPRLRVPSPRLRNSRKEPVAGLFHSGAFTSDVLRFLASIGSLALSGKTAPLRACRRYTPGHFFAGNDGRL